MGGEEKAKLKQTLVYILHGKERMTGGHVARPRIQNTTRSGMTASSLSCSTDRALGLAQTGHKRIWLNPPSGVHRVIPVAMVAAC